VKAKDSIFQNKYMQCVFLFLLLINNYTLKESLSRVKY